MAKCVFPVPLGPLKMSVCPCVTNSGLSALPSRASRTPERTGDVFGANGMMRDAPREGGQQARRRVRLEQCEALLDIAPPLRGSTVDQLREPRFGGRSELPETLALVVQPRPAAAHGIQHGRAVLGQEAQRFRAARMTDH